MWVLRDIVASLLALGFTWIATTNWIVLVCQLRGVRPSPSFILLLGGVLGAAALLVEPSGAGRHLWWAALLLDPGTVVGFVALAEFLAGKARGGKP